MDGYRKLVRLTASGFYIGEHPVRDPQSNSKIDRQEVPGLAVVLLEALTKRQWVKEEELAADLKLHAKQVRKCLKVTQMHQLSLQLPLLSLSSCIS